MTVLRDGVAYTLTGGGIAIECNDVRLLYGTLTLLAPPDRRSLAELAVGRAEVSQLRPATRLVARAAPNARLVLADGGVRVAPARFPRSGLAAQPGDVVLIGPDGRPRLSTWPFARSPHERRASARDRIPPFWSDGQWCSVGCRPGGARTGWPLRPFHTQHALRSALNELRPANMHIGVDIQALDGTPVYALQSGPAHVVAAGTVDERVQVGDYEYWHVIARVRDGQHIRAFHTVVGVVLRGAGHVHVSELRGGRYLDLLRPGGRVLAPYADTERPVIGRVETRGGMASVEVFDPQSYRVTLRYRTPVIAPAAVAWRARDVRGRILTPLTFAYRGSQHLANAFRSIYAPGTHLPDAPDPSPGGWACFRIHKYCVPRWSYRLWGLPARTATLTVYAWDWAGNVSIRSRHFGQALTSPLR